MSVEKGIKIEPKISIKVGRDIELCLPKLEDAEELFCLTDRNRAYLDKYLSWLDGCREVQDTKKFLEEVIASTKCLKALCFIIRFQEKQVGMLGCNEIDHVNRLATIGYWLDEAYQGMGITTQSLEALIGYLFSTLGLHRIEIRCAVENTRSWKIPEKLGFTREGVLKGAIYHSTGYFDVYLYGLVSTDYKKCKR